MKAKFFFGGLSLLLVVCSMAYSMTGLLGDFRYVPADCNTICDWNHNYIGSGSNPDCCCIPNTSPPQVICL